MATITANTGSNNWNTNGAWVGAVQPTAADDVIIPASAVVTIPTATTALGRSLTVQASGTLAFASTTATLNLGDATAGAGNVAISISATATITLTGIGTINLISTSATVQTIATGGKTMPLVRVNGAGSSYQLTSSYTTASFMSLTSGTLDTNGQTCSWANFDLGVGTKTLTLGASAITITGTGTAWSASTNGANFTLNAGTSTITLTGANASFAGNGKTYYNVSFTGSGTSTITGANSYNNFTAAPSASGAQLALAISSNQTAAAALTMTGVNSGTSAGRVFMCVAFAGTASPITFTAATISLTNADFMDVIAAGAAIPWTGTSIGDAGGNTNITFDSPRTLYWIGNGGSTNALAKYSLTSGGAAANTVPLPQDDLLVDANSITSAGQTITHALRLFGKNINFTGVLNSPTLTLGGFNPITTGSLTLAAGMTCIQGASSNHQFTTRQASTFEPAGNSLTWGLNFASPGGVGGYTLQSSLVQNSTTNGVAHTSGGFDANGYDVTVRDFASQNTNTRSLTMGTGTWTVTGSGVAFNCATVTGLSFSGASAKLIFSDTSATAKTLEHRQTTNMIGTVEFAAGGGSNIILPGSGARIGTLILGANKTYLFNTAGIGVKIDSLVAKGTAGNLVTIKSQTSGVESPGTAAPITQVSGIVNCDYLSVKDSAPTGGATFYAGPNSTNVSNNSGWIFAAATYAITKSLKYNIKLPTINITKSLQYSVKPSIALTKSLKYTVKTIPSAVTKSLRYAVRIVWGSWSKTPAFVQGTSNTGTSVSSLSATLNGVQAGNAIIVGVIIPNSGAAVSSISAAGLTFGRQYVIGDGGTDTAHYYYAETNIATGGSKTITVNFGGTVTKAIIFVREFANIKTDAGTNPDLTIRTASNYDNNGGASGTAANVLLSANNSDLVMSMAVNNNGYSWTGARDHFLAASAGTLSAAAQDAVNTGASGSFGNAFTQGTNGVYFATAVSYISTIDTTRSPLQKSLQYDVRQVLAVTKSLKYSVKAAISATKSLKYTIKATPTAITKALKYTVKVVPAALTKSLKYTIKKTPSITKGLIYRVKVGTPITKSLKYTTKTTRPAITKALGYRLLFHRSTTLSLTYFLSKLPTATTPVELTTFETDTVLSADEQPTILS
jgi:hypothetical protein